jgi:nucleoside-diphosphate-sugar epimerase
MRDVIEPAINGTTGLLKAVKSYAPTVKRVVYTSSFSAMLNVAKHEKTYSEKHWNPETWDEAVSIHPYRASKVRCLGAVDCSY